MTGNKRPRSVYCSPEERDEIGARAAAAGMTVSSFVLERGLAGGGAGEAAAGLTAAERAELHAGVRRLIDFAGMILIILGVIALVIGLFNALTGGKKSSSSDW